MTTEEAIRELLAKPELEQLMLDAYLARSPEEDAEAFSASGEFAEVLRLLGGSVQGQTIVDLGAGRGLASYGFIQAGAKTVYAVEPDPSELVGYGALRQLNTPRPIVVISSFGESIPLPDSTADVVYVRQVLHHAQNLDSLVAECYRLLKPGGMFMACREHVADNEEQLREFLSEHPVHQLAEGEYAYTEERYVEALVRAGFDRVRVVRPWDSVINAYPLATTQEDLEAYLRRRLKERYGAVGSIAGALPVLRRLYVRKLNSRPIPGRLCSFIGQKSK